MKKFTRLVSLLLAAALAMTAMCVGAAASSYSWTGTWSTPWGDMKLTQNGSSVTGSYTHDGGTISGTVSGSTLTGTWKEPGQVGKIKFTMASDGMSFTGLWGYNDEEPKRTDWNGTRKTKLAYTDGDDSSGKASASLSGLKWDSSANKLSFVIKFAKVKSDAWVGIVPSGTADDEKSADKADVTYKYLSSLKSGSTASLSASLKEGSYELRVYADDNGGALLARAKFSVSGKAAVNADLLYFQVTLKKGATLQLDGVLSVSTSAKITYSSSKTSVASVSSSGKVTAKGKGTALITAKCGSSSIKIGIKVTA